MRLILYMGLAASLCESFAHGCSCARSGSYCTAVAGTSCKGVSGPVQVGRDVHIRIVL
jgi:hypothetical protein